MGGLISQIDLFRVIFVRNICIIEMNLATGPRDCF